MVVAGGLGTGVLVIFRARLRSAAVFVSERTIKDIIISLRSIGSRTDVFLERCGV